MKCMTNLRAMEYSKWKPGTLLRVSGEDAANFLQGQFTNELRGLAAGSGVYGLWLNQKGKVLGDSFVLPGVFEGELMVASYFCPAEGIVRRLEDYVIADDVVLEEITAGWMGVSIFGVGAQAWLAENARIGRIFPGRRTTEASWEWIFPVECESDVLSQLAGAVEIGADEVVRRRIEAGIPAIPFDIGPGDLPGEGGLEVVAISYTKGCYLGQEVMARLKSMGQVRRRLMRVCGRGELPVMPAGLWQGAKQVGELRSAVGRPGGFTGLAMLSLVNWQPGVAMAREANGPAEIEVVPAEPTRS
jgi:folate-binding protein YgfZ